MRFLSCNSLCQIFDSQFHNGLETIRYSRPRLIIAMLILPLPTFLLDILFTLNIMIALIVIMIAILQKNPLDFSAFPAVLLFATMLRLSLNVASTRIVLVNGHEGTDAAGKVIEAFGKFVISGNYLVGFIIFGILMIINFIVVTKVRAAYLRSSLVSRLMRCRENRWQSMQI